MSSQRLSPALCLLGLLFASCASQETFRVPVVRPAVVDLARYDLVAVDRFSGEGAELLDTEMTAALREAVNPVTERADFEIVQRGDVDRMIDDMRRYPNANLDGPDSPVAKWKTAKVQVSGEVHAHRVEQTDDAERWTDPRGVPHTTFGRRAVAQVAVTIEAIESERSNVFDRVRYDEQVAAETQAVDCEPAAIDHDALLANARRRVVDRYLRRVMPHVDYVVVHLFVDGDLPGLEVGNGFARTGDWPAALDSYRTAAEMATGDLAEVRYKALHNVGVASLYTDDFEAARRALKEAYALGREPASLRQLEMVAQREQELEQLRQRNERAAEPAR